MPVDGQAEIRALTTRVVYANRWMTVREDRVRRADGSEGIYGVVEKPDFAVIIPLADDGRLHLVSQYRYPVGERFWEFPQGSWEAQPNADPIELARGELAEEAGLEASTLKHVGHLFEAYGYADQGYDIFLATGLTMTTRTLDVEEFGLVTQAFTRAEFTQMIVTGQIKDASTIAAFGLALLKGEIV